MSSDDVICVVTRELVAWPVLVAGHAGVGMAEHAALVVVFVVPVPSETNIWS